MSLSNICRSIRHFYLNYHHGKSHSLYLHSAFTRRLQFGFRLVATLLIGGFVGYASPLHSKLSLVYLIPNFSILCIRETFGDTLTNVLHLTSVIVPLSIFLFIVQKIGLSYHDYLAGEFLLLFSSFCISYQCPKLQTRKLSLWFNATFFVTIINSEGVSSTFVFELLSEFVLGALVALVVSTLIFPLFATCDVENRFNYCLIHLDQMQTLLLQAFLCQDEAAASISLARSTIIERRIRHTIIHMRERIDEAQFEPSRFFQWLFNRKRRHIINLTIKDEEDLISTLLFHVYSLQSMIKKCSFNKYHNDLIESLQTNISQLNSSQSKVISGLVSPSSLNREIFIDHLTDLQTALSSLNSAYTQARLRCIEEVLQNEIPNPSADHLSHAFFFFQLDTIVRLLTQATAIYSPQKKFKLIELKDSLKELFKFRFDWSRILSAAKSMFILGVGSIFVMAPSLANAFADGQWVLTGLCMTQGDTVGGAFTTMRMRLIGTLLGSMWAYATYLAVGDNSYQIFGMLVPWLFLFGYLRLIPHWDYTAVVAASTPVVVNLGRLYSDPLREGNYVLLRIQESIIGIGLGALLTILIFPVFAVDLLKVNIQDTLKSCRKTVQSIHSVYNQLYESQHSRPVSITNDQKKEIKLTTDLQRNDFIHLISTQRTLLNSASQEPSVWWFNYSFSSERYNRLVQEQVDIFRMLHNMHTALIHIHQSAEKDNIQIENFYLSAAMDCFLPNLDRQLANLSQQLSDCVDLWTSYFTLTQTTYYRWSRLHVPNRKKKLIKGDLTANQQLLIELHRTVLRLQVEYEQAMNHIFDYYKEQSAQGNELSSFVPYINSQQAEVVFVALSAMYYSTIQLAQAALAVGTTIRTIFELETTTVYRYF